MTATITDDTAFLAGMDITRPLDLILINSPLKNYDRSPRYTDFTLPVHSPFWLAISSRQATGIAQPR
jgi:hypothetical protein